MDLQHCTNADRHNKMKYVHFWMFFIGKLLHRIGGGGTTFIRISVNIWTLYSFIRYFIQQNETRIWNASVCRF